MIGEILKKSFKITWRNPGLWFFGFLSTFFFISANEFLLISFVPSLFLDFPSLRLGEVPFLKERPTLSPFFLIFSLVLIIFLFLLAVFSEIFLILSLKKKEGFFLRGVGKESLKYIGRVFFLKVLVGFLFFFLWFIFSLLAKNFSPVLIFLFILFSLISLVLLFVLRYSIFFIVIEEEKFLTAIKNSFLFLKRHLIETLKMSLFLFLIVSLYTLIAFSLFEGGFFTYPLRIFNLIFSNLFGQYGFWGVAIFTAFFVLILQVFLAGLVVVYQVACWLFLFLKIRGEGVNKI